MIYFIRSGKTGPIKIGYVSRDRSLTSRRMSLQVGNPEELYTLGVLDGYGLATEQALHKAFRAYRVRGEWFEACDSLLAFIYDCANDPDNVDFYLTDLGVRINKGGRPRGDSAAVNSWVDKKQNRDKKSIGDIRREEIKNAIADGSLVIRDLTKGP